MLAQTAMKAVSCSATRSLWILSFLVDHMRKGLLAFTSILSPVVALHAHAEIYMSDAQAASTIFPGGKFEKQSLELKDDEVERIKKESGENVRSRKLTVFRAEGAKKDLVYVDQVLGKHEFITYAVGIDSNGQVAGIEVLEYRESYGQDIRKAEWRKQFHGKDLSAPLKIGKDIQNISGATLSSSHITAGVRRVLKTHEVIASRL